MKQKDVALIAIIVFISAIMSIVISQQIFVSPKNRQQEVEVVLVIKDQMKKPDSRFFNANSFDPTQTITIGDNSSSDPFSTKKQ